MKCKHLLVFGFIFSCMAMQAQDFFSQPIEVFSKKKTAYVTMADGTEVEGTIHKIKRKKGLFEEVSLYVNEKKTPLKAGDIAHMYLPQSDWDKLGKALDVMDDATQWNNDENVNMDYITDGYAYFETSTTNYRKNKTADVLLQLLNPAFANKIKVYHDPYATESASVGVAGIKMAGGNDKSYFVKKGDETAFRLKSKDYKDYISKLYGDCDVFEKDKKFKWSYFGDHLMTYSKECN